MWRSARKSKPERLEAVRLWRAGGFSGHTEEGVLLKRIGLASANAAWHLNGCCPNPGQRWCNAPGRGLSQRRNLFPDSLIRPRRPHSRLRAGTEDGGSGRDGFMGPLL